MGGGRQRWRGGCGGGARSTPAAARWLLRWGGTSADDVRPLYVRAALRTVLTATSGPRGGAVRCGRAITVLHGSLLCLQGICLQGRLHGCRLPQIDRSARAVEAVEAVVGGRAIATIVASGSRPAPETPFGTRGLTQRHAGVTQHSLAAGSRAATRSSAPPTSDQRQVGGSSTRVFASRLDDDALVEERRRGTR